MNFEKELATLIKAKNPNIWVLSFEEKRLERILLKIAEAQISKETKQPKKFVVWTATKGFEVVKDMTADGRTILSAEAADISTAFKQVVDEAKKGGGTIYLFKDLHRYMGQNDNLNYRLLRDACETVKASRSTIIILSPVLAYPKEVEKIISVLDMPLPSKDELKEVLELECRASDIDMPENGDLEAVLRAGAGLTEDEFENVIAKSIVMLKKVDPKMVVSEKEQIIKKSGVIDIYSTQEGMNDIGGLENAKDWARRRKASFTEKAKEFGIRPPKGIFLVGVPGCGKSLLAKALSNDWNLPLMMVDASKVLGSYVGQSEQNIRQLFKTAEAIAPAILFFDEVEKMMPQGTSGDSGVTSRIFGILLNWMQERDPNKPVVVVMTANNPTLLPPELFSRFDATFVVNLPNVEERKQIWAVQIRKAKRDTKIFDIDTLAAKSENWSGREMENLIAEALTNAFDEGKELTTEHVLSLLSTRTPLAVARKADIDKMLSTMEGKAIPASKQNESKKTVGRQIEKD